MGGLGRRPTFCLARRMEGSAPSDQRPAPSFLHPKHLHRRLMYVGLKCVTRLRCGLREVGGTREQGDGPSRRQARAYPAAVASTTARDTGEPWVQGTHGPDSRAISRICGTDRCGKETQRIKLAQSVPKETDVNGRDPAISRTEVLFPLREKYDSGAIHCARVLILAPPTLALPPLCPPRRINDAPRSGQRLRQPPRTYGGRRASAI